MTTAITESRNPRPRHHQPSLTAERGICACERHLWTRDEMSRMRYPRPGGGGEAEDGVVSVLRVLYMSMHVCLFACECVCIQTHGRCPARQCQRQAGLGKGVARVGEHQDGWGGHRRRRAYTGYTVFELEARSRPYRGIDFRSRQADEGPSQIQVPDTVGAGMRICSSTLVEE